MNEEDVQIGWREIKAWLKEWWLILLVTIVTFSPLVVVWTFTDMYKAEQALQRQQAINYLRINYWDDRFPDTRLRIMDDFHLTDKDFTPLGWMEAFHPTDKDLTQLKWFERMRQLKEEFDRNVD